MRRWPPCAAASVSADQDWCLSRLGPTEKKVAARSDLRFGLLPIGDHDLLLYPAARLGPSCFVGSQCLYHRCRQDHLSQEKTPVLYSAEIEPACACHFHFHSSACL